VTVEKRKTPAAYAPGWEGGEGGRNKPSKKTEQGRFLKWIRPLAAGRGREKDHSEANEESRGGIITGEKGHRNKKKTQTQPGKSPTPGGLGETSVKRLKRKRKSLNKMKQKRQIDRPNREKKILRRRNGKGKSVRVGFKVVLGDFTTRRANK